MLEISDYKLYEDQPPRKLFVLKGPTFDIANKKYLFIIHDAQNFFDDKYLKHKLSWQIALALKQIGVSNYLVAGLACKNGFERYKEYSPVAIDNTVSKSFATKSTTRSGQKYLQLLKTKLLIDLERKYHFSFKAVQSCMIGASMGGVITTYEALSNPHTYTGYIAFSPALFINKPYIHNFIKSQKQIGNYFFSMGGKEETKPFANYQDYIDCFRFLKAQVPNLGNANIQSHYDPVATHDEGAWAKLLPTALKWFVNLK